MSPLADLHVRPEHSAPPVVRGDERRRHWLVPTGVIAALAVILFLLTFELNPAIAVTGIVLVAAFYVAMLVCAALTRNVHNRNVAFVWLFGGITVTSSLLLILLFAIEQID
jgi:hypothetical protein